MNKITLCFYCLLLTLSTLNAQEASPENLLRPTGEGKVTTVNRILAKVNGRAISALDVQHKIDVMFYKQFPQYANIPEARYQFYMNSWKFVLNDLINKELILADAKTMKVEVASGDIRQELEDTFGPHMLANLEQAGLTYEDAWTMTHDDIMLRRMMMARVNSKAMMKVGPKQIYEAYGTFAADKSGAGEWLYQVVTVRSDDESLALDAAKRSAELLREGRCSLSDVKACLELEGTYKDLVSLSVSSDIRRTHEDISEAHNALVQPLEEGEISSPQLQLSRADGKQVARFALLKEKVSEDIPGFNEVAMQLREGLLQQAVSEETQRYFTFLRKQYSVEEMFGEAGSPPPFIFTKRPSSSRV